MVATAERQVSALRHRFHADVHAALRGAVPDSESGFFGLLRYHLGWEQADGTEVIVETGKGLRPVLCLTACELAGGDWHKALLAAAALELIHNFSLIHDDIQDHDTTRWGRPTLWSARGVPAAVSAGNAMRVIAGQSINQLTDVGLAPGLVAEAALVLNQRGLEMIEGQYMDLAFEESNDVTVEQYLAMIDRKTGALIDSAMYMGALVATEDQETALAFGRCGRKLGIAFQIRDDYLGVWGETTATGKAVGADIRRKKKSIPVVHLFQNASATDRAWLEEAYATEGEVGGEEVERILELLDHLETPAYVRRSAETHADEAMKTIAGLSLSDEARTTLEAMAQFFVTREK